MSSALDCHGLIGACRRQTPHLAENMRRISSQPEPYSVDRCRNTFSPPVCRCKAAERNELPKRMRAADEG